MLNRRGFLAFGALAVCSVWTGPTDDDIPTRDGVPSVDDHVHVGEEIPMDQAAEMSGRRNVKFGLVQHARLTGQGYAISDDDTLDAWVRSPV